ncbi:MAG: hypothetical protein K2O39_04415, partial [Clostridiales bacterium]|nr:hypothetical protein [Clostridiales bacterium]
VRFSLTDNAVWADGSVDDIDVTLVIKKLAHEDPFIKAGATGAIVDGRTATYTYELDPSSTPTVGAAIERIMTICNFNADTPKSDGTGTYTYDYMKYDKNLTTGKTVEINGAGYLSAGVANTTLKEFEFTATNADTYVVTFVMTDPDNHCWKFADVSSVSFIFKINKRTIANPIIETEYLLTTESVGGTEMSVDFDKHAHTILIKSLFENIHDDGTLYDVGNTTGLGTKYYTVDNTTDKRHIGVANYSSSHANAVANYDDTDALSMKVENLFDNITLPSDYYKFIDSSDKVGQTVSILNLFTLTAYTPGEYYLTFKLTDPANMTWADGSTVTVDSATGDTYIDYKLVINKVKHAAPT